METLAFYTKEKIVLRAGINDRERLLKLIKKMHLTLDKEVQEYDTLVDYSKGENPIKLSVARNSVNQF